MTEASRTSLYEIFIGSPVNVYRANANSGLPVTDIVPGKSLSTIKIS